MELPVCAEVLEGLWWKIYGNVFGGIGREYSASVLSEAPKLLRQRFPGWLCTWHKSNMSNNARPPHMLASKSDSFVSKPADLRIV